MQMQAFHLVTDGITTVQEVLRSVYAPGVEEKDEAPKELGPGKRMLRPGMDSLPGGQGVLPGETSSRSDQPNGTSDPLVQTSTMPPPFPGKPAGTSEEPSTEAPV